MLILEYTLRTPWDKTVWICMSRKLEKPKVYKFNKVNKVNKWLNDAIGHAYGKKEGWIVYLKGMITKKSSYIIEFS